MGIAGASIRWGGTLRGGKRTNGLPRVVEAMVCGRSEGAAGRFGLVNVFAVIVFDLRRGLAPVRKRGILRKRKSLYHLADNYFRP